MRVILDGLVTPAEVKENLPMVELLWRSCFRWCLWPRSVTGDAAYGTIENIAAVEKADIRAYMALSGHDKRAPLFGKNEFIYDAQKTSTAVHKARSCVPKATTMRRAPSDRLGVLPIATYVSSRADAPRASRGAGSGVVLTRSISKGCDATATPKPTARH